MYAHPQASHVMLRGLVHMGSVAHLEDRVTPNVRYTTDLHGSVTTGPTQTSSTGSSTQDGPPDVSAEIPDDELELPPGFIAPGAVPVVVEAWDLDADPETYKIQLGDTLVGLAATYLGDGGRWREIWDFQTPELRSRNTPDAITTTRTLRMPKEAAANLRMWIDRGKPTQSKPGELKPNTIDKLGGKKNVAIAAAATVGVLGIGYVLLR